MLNARVSLLNASDVFKPDVFVIKQIEECIVVVEKFAYPMLLQQFPNLALRLNQFVQVLGRVAERREEFSCCSTFVAYHQRLLDVMADERNPPRSPCPYVHRPRGSHAQWFEASCGR